jgi:ribonucleoside-diphosphate reductase alpha chain
MDLSLMVPIAEEIWNLKYRLREADGSAVDGSVDETFARVAQAAASTERGGKRVRDSWAKKFQEAMADFGFLPGGRILAGAGAKRNVTLFNCFVMGTVPDDLRGIFEEVRNAALTMQMGGGIGVDFSTLRPRGARVHRIGADASGPVSFMEVWDAMCHTIMSAGARRGAMMGTLRADHPDIEEFIDAKSAAGRLTNFNLSVLVPDALMDAVDSDGDWDLSFGGKVYRTVRARDLWERIMRATYEFSEPGVIFIDRVNAQNNLSYCETIHATNPCGEQPLPPFGACLLGALSLNVFVRDPFTARARLDTDALAERAAVAVRFLDDVIDLSRYPLPQQKKEALAKRRMGLGITGLADALIMCGVNYGSSQADEMAGRWMRTVQEAAYRASAALAEEKGSFPLLDKSKFLRAPMIERLDPEISRLIAEKGLRNGCLTTIAPTGTTSLLAGNVSSGIEPVFDFVYTRRVLEADGSHRTEQVEDLAYAHYKAMAHAAKELPSAFVRARDLEPLAHLKMQAAMQPYVDSSISKTINCPEELPFESFKHVYKRAHTLGLKGCTTYRPSPVRGAVLASIPEEAASCTYEATRADREREVLAPSVAAAQSATGAGEIVYLSKPLEREAILHGATYKLKWPGSEHALYITINDIERDGRRRPFEIFINTKSLEHYAWTIALTRMISAVFRRGGDVTFVAEELQAIFDPQGGCWISGRYVPSIQAAIGEIIEGHMKRIGFIPENESAEAQRSAARLARGAAAEAGEGARPNRMKPAAAQPSVLEYTEALEDRSGRRQCPRCGASGYVRREGCWTCERCGFSQCD